MSFVQTLFILGIQVIENSRLPLTLSLAILPSLYKKHTFSLDISTIAHNRCSYPIVIGHIIMHYIKLEVSVLKNAFKWHSLTGPFIPFGHCADSQIERFCQVDFLTRRNLMLLFQIHWGRILNISMMPILPNWSSRRKFANLLTLTRLYWA